VNGGVQNTVDCSVTWTFSARSERPPTTGQAFVFLWESAFCRPYGQVGERRYDVSGYRGLGDFDGDSHAFTVHAWHCMQLFDSVHHGQARYFDRDGRRVPLHAATCTAEDLRQKMDRPDSRELRDGEGDDGRVYEKLCERRTHVVYLR